MNIESRVRLKNSLWGLFIGDALAMPAHWYYREDNISKVFDGGILGYEDAPHPHLESFMVGMAYQPDVETAKRQGRPFDIPVGLGTDGTRVSSYIPWFSLYWAVTGKAFGGDQMFSEQNMLSRQKAL